MSYEEEVQDDDFYTILISPGCTNNCIFCQQTYSRSDTEGRARIVKEQEIQIVKGLKEAKAIGKKGISITGSDPLEYPKLVPMVRYIHSLGFKAIRICTHGRLKKGNEKMVHDLIDAGMVRLRVPLYGSTAKIHDSITQSEGSFEELMNLFYTLYPLRDKVKFNVVSLALQQNKHDLLNIVRYAFQFGVSKVSFDVSHVYPLVKDHSFCISYKDLSESVREVFAYSEEKNLPVFFCDMPYCVFGRYSRNIVMPKNIFEKEKPKGKFEMCDSCKLSSRCDGFFLNNVAEWGLGNLKPIID